MTDSEKITSILKHIKRVEDNCNIVAKKLQDTDLTFSLNLIKRGRLHDASKFDYYEFNYLFYGSEYFKEALGIHHIKNSHHPEHHWRHNGIHGMSDLDLAEMVCDCVARSQEQGTDPRKWFNEEATHKYMFNMDDPCGVKIQNYLDLLLNKPFNHGNI